MKAALQPLVDESVMKWSTSIALQINESIRFV